MSIWFKKDWNIEKLNQFRTNTMNELIGIRFTEVGENYLKAIMPVDNRTRQAYGLLHGGASATLAETLGSVGFNYGCGSRTILLRGSGNQCQSYAQCKGWNCYRNCHSTSSGAFFPCVGN